MAFWTKKPAKNVELTEKEEISKLKARINRIEAEVLDIATAQEIIRNKVLRKIQGKRPIEEEETKDLYNGMLIKE